MAHRIALALIIALALGSAPALGESGAAGSRAAQLQDLAILRRDVAPDRAYSPCPCGCSSPIVCFDLRRCRRWLQCIYS
jgi:hypothetical protein